MEPEGEPEELTPAKAKQYKGFRRRIRNEIEAARSAGDSKDQLTETLAGILAEADREKLAGPVKFYAAIALAAYTSQTRDR